MTLRSLTPTSPHRPLVTMEVVTSTKSPEKSTGTLVGVASGVSLAIVLAVILLYFCMKKNCCRKYKHRSTSKGLQILDLRRFRMAELEKATDSFSKNSWIGKGAFGNVYKGIFDENITLAIKKAHVDSYQSAREFRNEVELLSRVKHTNLVGLVGYCEEQGQKILVYEYVPHGSLLESIAGKKKKPLTWIQRVHIAIGVAKGIAYLHEDVHPSIIHRDLKPSNILLGDGFEPKVSDFGLVKTGPVGDASFVSSLIKGTPGYLDPAYCSTFHLTPFSDVYSFGVILLQLVSARPAVDTLRPHSRYHIIEWARPSLERGIVEEIIDANLLLEACNMEMMLMMGQLGLRCIVKSHKDRPTMSQVARELEEALHSTRNFIHKLPRGGSSKLPEEEEESQVTSLNRVNMERFHEDTDVWSVGTASIRCLDLTSISLDNNNDEIDRISEERESIGKAVL